MPGPILLVHDDIAALAAIRRLLAREAYEVVLATSAADAVIAFGHHLPSLVILSPSVEGGRGHVVLDELKLHPDGRLARVLLLGTSIPGYGAPVLPLPLDGAIFLQTVNDLIRAPSDADAWKVLGPEAPKQSSPVSPTDTPEPWRATAPPELTGSLEERLFGDLPKLEQKDWELAALSPEEQRALLRQRQAEAAAEAAFEQTHREMEAEAIASLESVLGGDSIDSSPRGELPPPEPTDQELLVLEREVRAEAQRRRERTRALSSALPAPAARRTEDDWLSRDDAEALTALEARRRAEEQSRREREEAEERAGHAAEESWLQDVSEPASAEERSDPGSGLADDPAGPVEDARREEEERLAEEARREEEERFAKEARREEEERLAEEARREEEERLAEEARREEEERLAEEARREEEERLAEEARREEEERLAEEARRREEERLAEEVRLEEERRRAAGEAAAREEIARLERASREVHEQLSSLAATAAEKEVLAQQAIEHAEALAARERAAQEAAVQAEQAARAAQRQAEALAAQLMRDQESSRRTAQQIAEALRRESESALAEVRRQAEELLRREREERQRLAAELEKAREVASQALEQARAAALAAEREQQNREAAENARLQAEEAARHARQDADALAARSVLPLPTPGQTRIDVPLSGTVDLGGLARLMVQLAQARADVRIELMAQDVLRSLWLRRGALVAASSTLPHETLLDQARRDGLIDGRQEAELRLVRGASAAELHRVLKDRRYIRQTEAIPLVQRYTEQLALEALSEPESTYRLAKTEPPDEVLIASSPRPLLQLSAEALRRALLPDALLEIVGGLEAVPLFTELELDLRSLGFSERERQILAEVDGATSVEALVLQAGLRQDVGLRALAVARLLGLISMRPGEPRAHAEPPPELELERLLAKYEEIQEADYFAILGLPRSAGGDEVVRAFQLLSSEFNPLKFAGHPDASVQRRAQAVSEMLAEAAATLRDDRLRTQYARNLLD